jgi:aminomethyltransferase
MSYLCWCDDDGQVVDDGTVARLGDEHFRLTAAEPSLSWLEGLRRGFAVSIEDSSDSFGTLALQGPSAREILRPIVDTDIDALRFFGILRCRLAGIDIWLSRTGYTGDLGYEIWIPRENAEAAYDAVLSAGEHLGLLAVGLDAMDVSRIEAGFIMNGVDYYSANHCLTDERKASPWELGLGWTVNLDREPFVGQAALRRLKETGEGRRLVGLSADWDETEAIFQAYGLPPEIPTDAWRDGRPVYDESNRWIGQATSGAWSPILKANLALAQIDKAFAEAGTRVRFEITAEYHRHTVTATVTPMPFFNPPRKRA